MMLIVISGLPGSGKSTLAGGLAERLRAPVLSVDPIESALLEAGIERSWETGLAAYLVAQTCADEFLAAGLDVIIDAVSAVEAARGMWRTLAARHDAQLRVVECALDRAEASGRLAGRSRGLKMGEPSAADILARASEWTPWAEPHLVIDGADDREANLAETLRWLRPSLSPTPATDPASFP
jgi:predicted kinase